MGTNSGSCHPGKLNTWSWVARKYSARSIKDLKAIDLEKIPSKDAITIKQILKAYEDDDIRSVQFIAHTEDGTPRQTVETDNRHTITDPIKIEFVKPKK